MRKVVWIVGTCVLVLGGLLAAGCALVPSPPPAASLDERLSLVPGVPAPIEAPVSVRWNAYQVPFIEAETDGDAAFALGVVHAHLRLGQMGVLRRIVQGRTAESVGPLSVDLDAAIRTFDFYQPADEIYARMPETSRTWLDRYVAGVNFYAANLPEGEQPHEFKMLDIAWEPWTAQDSITIGRAAGIDINWGALITLMTIEDTDLRAKAMERALAVSQDGTSTFDPRQAALAPLPSDAFERLAHWGEQIGKSGSNSLAVAPSRSTTGAPLIANDPHLGFLIPNVWVVAGLRSPNYSVVGAMAVGTPVFGFGRNETLSWGGTTLRAATSDFVDVSDLPEEAFETRTHEIKVRFWFDATRTSRHTKYGPVLSEAGALAEFLGEDRKPFAVRWVGHQPTDEITALLGAMKARTFEDFRGAMKTFAVPPQTFIVADSEGTIGSVIATQVPARPKDTPTRLLVDPATSDAHWAGVYRSTDLPFQVDPQAGYLASANNRPTPDGSRPINGFFPQDERVRRLRALVDSQGTFSLADMKRLQLDTVSPLSYEVVQALAPRLRAWESRSEAEAEAIALMLEWDGDYGLDSRGARVFETFLTRFAPALYAQLGRADEFEVYQSLRLGRLMVIQDMTELSESDWDAVLAPALKRAGEVAADGSKWGDVHGLNVQHVFANLPLIGGRYRLDTIPVPGSRETVMKSAHDLTDEPHVAFYGAQSRHVSDLSDPDANYFVLLGGQDGRLNSENFADQVPLWRRGAYVRLPLSPGAVAAEFDRITRLTPQ